MPQCKSVNAVVGSGTHGQIFPYHSATVQFIQIPLDIYSKPLGVQHFHVRRPYDENRTGCFHCSSAGTVRCCLSYASRTKTVVYIAVLFLQLLLSRFMQISVGHNYAFSLLVCSSGPGLKYLVPMIYWIVCANQSILTSSTFRLHPQPTNFPRRVNLRYWQGYRGEAKSGGLKSSSRDVCNGREEEDASWHVVWLVYGSLAIGVLQHYSQQVAATT
jgi:hypothetical protein